MDHAEPNNKGVAIVGMAGRFPGARNPQQLWKNICAGVESISFFSEEEAVQAGVPPELARHPDYVRAWGYLDDIDKLDASFFGIPGREAEAMDPQHRFFLEVCAEALNDSGYDPQAYKGLIGVVSGVGISSYLLRNLIPNAHRMQALGEFQVFLGNDKDFMPTRASYKLNLRGASHSVSTGCSTTMVATHLACRSLLSYQNDICLAGGANIKLPQKAGYLYKKGELKSPDGRCRAFDASARGTVFGNGVAVVVLKRLKDAIEDGDHIYAVIKGTAINNDGSTKAGFTAPSVSGQANVIASAHAVAGLPAETITYMEAHGTGTPLGDPVEIKALNRVFRAQTDKKQYCAMGSIKTNVGHLDNVAGVTGLIKTALCLKNKKIPPSLHFETPNPEIDFAGSPFYINTELKDWQPDGISRRACVSAFGAGGTNAHAVLEEAPERKPSGPSRNWQLLTFSAKTATALAKMTENLAEHLRNHEDLPLADVIYTMNVGRSDFAYRRFAVVRDRDELIRVLEEESDVLVTGVQNPGSETREHSVANLIERVCATRDDNALEEALKALGQEWVEGSTIDWNAFYAGELRYRVPLPPYPFEGKRYWVDQPSSGIPDVMAKPATAKIFEKEPDMADWFYTASWALAPLPTVPNKAEKDCWIIFKDETGLGNRLADHLERAGHQVVLVSPGEEFDKPDDNHYVIDPAREEDYNGMLTEMQNLGKIPNRIAHLWTVGASHDNEVVMGLQSLENLVRSIGAQSYQNSLTLGVVSSGLHGISDTDVVIPARATLLGAVHVAPLEYPKIQCKSIEISLEDQWSDASLDALIAECQSSSRDRMVAYRGTHRWARHVQPVRLEHEAQADVTLKDQGVYLITGGLGGIGLVLADYLADKVNAKLALIGRTDLPNRDAWLQWIAEHEENDPVSVKIRAVERLEEKGSQVLTLQADVGDEAAMKQAVATIEKELGPINGVIHAAGSSDSEGIQRRGAESGQEILRAKVGGTLAIEACLEGKNPDFIALFSSLAAVMGGFGQISYVAANNFLDAYAESKAKSATQVMSINWEAWKEVGMASKLQTERLQKTGLTSAEGAVVFGRILEAGLPRVLVSTFDLPARLKRAGDIAAREESGVLRQELSRPTYPRPELSTAYKEPGTDLEKALSAIWQDMLGIEKIGVADDFFELGGDSLKGMNLVNRMEKDLAATFHIDALFETANIADLAAYLEEHYPAQVAALCGRDSVLPLATRVKPLEISDFAYMRERIPSLANRGTDEGPKNARAVFILAPPRSGSTLLRVMLAGHPGLFAPPELFLLGFNTFRERKAAFPGNAAHWLEGLTHAVMSVDGCSEPFADSLLLDWESREFSTKQVYAELQRRMGRRILVDKTPAYAYDLATLKRAEEDFHEPLFIHLVRNPYAMIHSYEKAKMDLLLKSYADTELPFNSRQMGELLWTICHQNILTFLEDIPKERKITVKYEDMVHRPAETARAICDPLDLAFEEDMVQVYKETTQRMTEGVRPGAKMLGDVNFHRHNTIDPEAAVKWKQAYTSDFLSATSAALSKQFGYEILDPDQTTEKENTPGIDILDRGEAGRLLEGMDQMSDEEVAAMLREMTDKE